VIGFSIYEDGKSSAQDLIDIKSTLIKKEECNIWHCSIIYLSHSIYIHVVICLREVLFLIFFTSSIFLL
jgi:hypothetical protein